MEAANPFEDLAVSVHDPVAVGIVKTPADETVPLDAVYVKLEL